MKYKYKFHNNFNAAPTFKTQPLGATAFSWTTVKLGYRTTLRQRFNEYLRRFKTIAQRMERFENLLPFGYDYNSAGCDPACVNVWHNEDRIRVFLNIQCEHVLEAILKI